jgi:outer membrane biosynthesis protein TonB
MEQVLDERRREFRRMVAWSAGAHLALLGLAMFSPSWSSDLPPTDVISVDLVSLAPARALPPPAPAAKPKPVEAEKPPPPPEPPKPDKTVIPTHPEREPDKPKPKPKPEVPPEPQPDKSLDDLLADFRKEAGETEPAPTPAPETPPETAVAPTGVPSSGAGIQVSPEVMAWIRKAKAHVRGVWVVPPGFRMEALETRVVVELDASGAVIGEPRITKKSGNPWYDEGVVRGIQKASPLPPPPRAGEWDFVFLPEDAF